MHLKKEFESGKGMTLTEEKEDERGSRVIRVDGND